MKKPCITILVVILLCLIFKQGVAQYDSLVVNHAVWIIEGDDPLLTPWPVDTVYGYYINGDTIDNGFTYKKVYRLNLQNHSQTNVPNYIPYTILSQFLYGEVRESNKIIYAKRFVNDILVDPLNQCVLNNEFTLHDYNLIVGDTIYECNMGQEIVDSIIYPSLYGHRAFCWNCGVTLLEGIGSNHGLYEEWLANVSGFFVMTLADYCKGDLQSCGLGFTNIEDHSRINFSINLFPNPSSTICTITATAFNPETLGATLTLYDITGRVLLRQKFNERATVDVSELKEGMYVVEIRDNEGRSLKGKLVNNKF